MAILSTIGVASFVNYSRAQILQQAANDLVTSLNTAKSMSVAQTTTSTANGGSLTCPSGQSLGGYGITIYTSTSPNSYNLYIQCPGVKKYATKSTSLPKNVSFGSGTTDIFFPILTGGVIGSGNIILNNTLSLPPKTIIIDSGGNILIPKS